MHNKLVYLQSLEGFNLKDVVITEDALQLTIGNWEDKKIKISHYHEQDCCESVYVDWSYVKDTSFGRLQALIRKQLHRLTIKGVNETGVLFRLSYFVDGVAGEQPHVESFAWLAPCYNDQNGYYSSELDLVVNGSVIPISSYVEDRIN
jgi:hypothetical protein